tara:strand:- start:438 stop:827 length:390 start_codon:yes stop_codon:yes gene_type:complete
MSTLKVNTIQNASGGNASTVDNIQQGIAKAWVNFNGTFSSSSEDLRVDSFNVSGVTDNATGIYTITFANNMANSNYVVNISKRLNTTGGATSSDDVITGLVNTAQTNTSVKVYTRNTDCIAVHVVVFGD